MERRGLRKRLRVIRDDEDCGDTRLRSRGKKRAIYTEYNDDNHEEDEEGEEDEEDDDQPGTSTQSTYDQRAIEKGLLNVTCGNKKGKLDVEKLGRGEECIECADRWFKAPAFEEFAGKGSSKKWKTSIFYKNKPLQFWFEQGYLTTRGFKRRTQTAKRRRILSESSSGESEIQCAEETEEDDVREENWNPDSEELETGSAKGGEVTDSGVDTSKDEEERMGDEDTSPVTDNDDSVVDELELHTINLTPKMSALQREVKVVVKRLPVKQTDCQSIPAENSQDGSWCKPLDEDALTEEEREHSSSAVDDSSITEATYTDSSWMSDPAVVGGAEEEFTQSIERKNYQQKKTQTETAKSAPAVLSPEFPPETAGIGSTSSHTASLRSTEDTVTDKRFVGITKDDQEKRRNRIVERRRKTEREERRCPKCRWSKDLEDSEINYLCFTNHTDSGLARTRLQLKRQVAETRFAQTSQTSDMLEAPPSRPSTSCDLDTMGLDQLRREKIKMQIKVLRLQEEYYTQKIHTFK